MKPIDMQEILQVLYILQLLADPQITGSDREHLLEKLRDQRARVSAALQVLENK